jgi:hypothetical protein
MTICGGQRDALATARLKKSISTRRGPVHSNGWLCDLAVVRLAASQKPEQKTARNGTNGDTE